MRHLFELIIRTAYLILSSYSISILSSIYLHLHCDISIVAFFTPSEFIPIYQALTFGDDLTPLFNNAVIFNDFSKAEKHAVSFTVLVQSDGRFKNAALKAMH